FIAGCLLWVTGHSSLPVKGCSRFPGTAFFIAWLGLFSSELAGMGLFILICRQFRHRYLAVSRWLLAKKPATSGQPPAALFSSGVSDEPNQHPYFYPDWCPCFS